MLATPKTQEVTMSYYPHSSIVAAKLCFLEEGKPHRFNSLQLSEPIVVDKINPKIPKSLPRKA